MMKFFCIAFLFYLSTSMNDSIGQTSQCNVKFQFLINEEPLIIGKNYFVSSLDDSIKIDRLKLYISNIELSNKNDSSYARKNHYLLDIEKEESLHISLPSIENHTQLNFQLGIDSLVNVSGVMGGALDPMNGMYWSWQSGYINIKLEGVSPSCPARKNEFSYHLGGYSYPNNTLQAISLMTRSRNELIIEIDLTEFFRQVDLRKEYAIMSPSSQAVKMAQHFSSLFRIK